MLPPRRDQVGRPLLDHPVQRVDGAPRRAPERVPVEVDQLGVADHELVAPAGEWIVGVELLRIASGDHQRHSVTWPVRSTAVVGQSARRLDEALERAWRTRPSLVNSAISTRARSSGSTHVAVRATEAGGGGSNGHSATTNPRRRSVRPRKVRWSKPVPTPPANASPVRRGSPDQQRAERVGTVAGAGGEAADRQLDLGAVLDLAPVLGARAGPVARVDPLRDHTFQTLLGGRRHERCTVAEPERRHRPVVSGLDELLEQPAPVQVGEIDGVVAVDLEDVEELDHRLAVRADAAALGELEARSPVVVEHDQLAVEDRRPGVHRAGQIRELRPAIGDVVAGGALESHTTVGDVSDRAVAVPLDLEGPVVAVGHGAGRAHRRLHRRDREAEGHGVDRVRRRGGGSTARRRPRAGRVGRRRSRAARRAAPGCPRRGTSARRTRRRRGTH